MQKFELKNLTLHKMSLQQIQFAKLLQVSSLDMDAYVQKELEENPALDKDDSDKDESMEADLDLQSYRTKTSNYNPDMEKYVKPITKTETLYEKLYSQLKCLKLDERRNLIGKQILGSLDVDGYLRVDLESICDDISFTHYIDVDRSEIDEVLSIIHTFDPCGVAARNLRECLTLQLKSLKKDSPNNRLALKILKDHFEEFSNKHHDKIIEKLNITEDEFIGALGVIKTLNPKPVIGYYNEQDPEYIYPDFIVTSRDGKLEVSLAKDNVPNLKINTRYKDLDGDKEVKDYIKSKINSARWFIDSINQRKKTLLKTINAIIDIQRDFFMDEDASLLKPMVLRDIAKIIGMDISTVSRVISNKYVQTDYGIYSLKYFFSEGIKTSSGEVISSSVIKDKIKQLIEREDKSQPITDDKISHLLSNEGYNVARRTVAKYREQLKIPVTRLRKTL